MRPRAQRGGVHQVGGGGRIRLGTPVINSAEMLFEILNGGNQVWLVVDEMSWRRHYSPEYRELVEKRLRPVGEFTGVLVFVPEG